MLHCGPCLRVHQFEVERTPGTASPTRRIVLGRRPQAHQARERAHHCMATLSQRKAHPWIKGTSIESIPNVHAVIECVSLKYLKIFEVSLKSQMLREHNSFEFQSTQLARNDNLSKNA